MRWMRSSSGCLESRSFTKLPCVPSESRYLAQRMEFFKSFGITVALGVLFAVSILIMVKGSGLLSAVPFLAYLVGFIYIFTRYGLLPSEDDQH
jgi:hypothetical protein